MTATDTPAKRGAFAAARRFVPLAALCAGLAAFFIFRLDRYLSLSALADHRAALLGWVKEQGVLAPIIFTAVYAAAVATSVPGGLVLTVAGGFLFGTVLGAICAVVGATIGATAVFLAARTALAGPLRVRAGPTLRRMEAGFQKDAASYMLHLRLVPIYPFWLVNLVPALLGVPFTTYLWTTLAGIIPGSAVYASVGNGLGELFEAGQMPNLSIFARPAILVPLVALGVLSLVPVVYKGMMARRKG